jgi:hypothetical protein
LEDEDKDAQRRSTAGSDFSYLSPEQRLLQDYPLCAICAIAYPMLKELSGGFDLLYASNGRPSIVPETLLPVLKDSKPSRRVFNTQRGPSASSEVQEIRVAVYCRICAI